jgi:hypothetical protein
VHLAHTAETIAGIIATINENVKCVHTGMNISNKGLGIPQPLPILVLVVVRHQILVVPALFARRVGRLIWLIRLPLVVAPL